MLHRTLVLVSIAATWLAAGAFVQAQDRAIVQMRDGKKVEGAIEELTGDMLVLRVSLNDQRRIAVRETALIDRVGGASGLPDNETQEAAGAPHLLVLSNGSSLKGQLVAIRGGEGSANPNQPRTYVFRADGREAGFPPEKVSRVYLGSYPFAPAAAKTSAPTNTSQEATRELAAGADVPGAVHVPATAGWVNTRLQVRRGEMISFNTTGEVQLSDNPKDRARSAGTPRTAPGAPLPGAYAGALIGRVGNSPPFGIGDQSAVPMPVDGTLFLAVNDDERSDNAGEFVVVLGRVRR